MEVELNEILRRLNDYNKEVQVNINKLLDRYAKENWKNLPSEEQKTNRIDIYRSLESNNCNFACFHIDSEHELIDQLGDNLSFEQTLIFDKWDEIWDLDKTDEAVEKYGEIFEVELDVLFVSWIVKNWWQVKNDRKFDFQYCITENNSQRSFDLNLLEWDRFIDIYHYEKYLNGFEEKFPSELNLKNRIMMDYIWQDINLMERRFVKDEQVVTILFENWSVKIKDSIKGITFEENLENDPDKYERRNQVLKRVVDETKLLLNNEFVEM